MGKKSKLRCPACGSSKVEETRLGLVSMYKCKKCGEQGSHTNFKANSALLGR